MEQAEEEDFGTSTLGQVEIIFVHPWTGGDYIFNIIFSVTTTT